MTCANARMLQPHKKTESNNTHKKESQHEDKRRSCGQEHNLHQNMFFSATLLQVLLGRRVHSTCLVASLSTPWHGEDRGIALTFVCLPSNALFGLFTTCGHSQGVGTPTGSRMQLHLRPDSRTSPRPGSLDVSSSSRPMRLKCFFASSFV